VEVKKGETIRLNCGAVGFPPPVFAWYKDGGRLSVAHDRYEMSSDGVLTITNAQLDDSAHFRCSASNYLGRAGTSARVKVNPDEPESENDVFLMYVLLSETVKHTYNMKFIKNIKNVIFLMLLRI